MAAVRRENVLRDRAGRWHVRWRLSSAWIGALGLCYVGLEVHDGDSGAGSMGAGGRSGDWRQIGPAQARAEFPEGVDSDGDGLADDFEQFAETSMYDGDCDDDGVVDGAEWILRSDPNDAASLPEIRPAVRSYAYEADGALRVCTGFYPSNFEFIEAASFVVGSPTFTDALEGDPGTGLGVFDLSDVLPTIATNVCGSSYLGLGLASFDVEFDLSALRSTPLVFGWALRLAGVDVIDQVYVSTEGSTSYVVAGGPALPGAAIAFVAAPLQPIPPPDDEQPEYCSVGFSDGIPAGVATLEFTVTDAGCEPDGLLYCIAADCTALAGQTFLMLDYGYLQGKLGN